MQGQSEAQQPPLLTSVVMMFRNVFEDWRFRSKVIFIMRSVWEAKG